jgi:hypothetical protein
MWCSQSQNWWHFATTPCNNSLGHLTQSYLSEHLLSVPLKAQNSSVGFLHNTSAAHRFIFCHTPTMKWLNL